ncbi:MAG: peptidase [Frankiales bacterium]|nr:peptidase [Frankiales bacterium]
MTAPTRRPPAVVPAGPRLEARASAARSARRGRVLHRIGNGLAVLLPLLALAWVLLASTWLGVDRVEVLGLERLQSAAVVEAAAVANGTPLARVDTGAVERRVAELAPVDRVAVRRTWPGTLTVDVTERTVVGGVLHDGRYTLLDAEGVTFASEAALPKGAVRLEVVEPGPKDPSTLAALEVYAALPEALRTRVAIVRATSPSAVVLRLSDGRQVVWGRPGETDTKSAAALALLSKPGTTFDVSAGDVVVVSGQPSVAPGSG